MKTRSASPVTRHAVLNVIEHMFDNMRERYLVILNDTVPFISELLEEFVVLLELLILDTFWILLIHICLFIPLCQLLISILLLINSCFSLTFIAKLFRSFLLLIVFRVHHFQVLHLKFFNLCLLFPVLFSLFLFSIFSLLFLFRKLGLILL